MSDVAAAPSAAPVEASGSQPAPAGSEGSGNLSGTDELSGFGEQGDNAEGNAPKDAASEPKPLEKYKVKVAGQEREVTIDDLRKRYERDEGAAHRFEEAARIRKEAEAKELAFTQDPVGFLMKAGKVQEARQLAEKLILEQIEEERLTPEQRRIKELEARLKADEDAKEAARQAEEEAEVVRQEQEYSKTLVGDLKAAFTKAGLGLDDSLHLTGVVKFLQNARAAGEEVSVDEAVEYAQYEQQERTSRFLSSLPPEQLINYLGPAILGKIRQADLAQIKKPNSQEPSNKQPAAPRKEPAKELRSADDFFLNLR